MSNNHGINPHCLNKYSGEKPLIGKDDNRAIGCVDLASQMGYIISKNYASAFGKHIFKLYRQKEKGIQWTYD